MTTNERWRLAVHESAHAVAAVLLGGKCTGVLVKQSCGVAFVSQLCVDRDALCYAAGPAAESLATEFDPPSEIERTADELTNTQLPTSTDEHFRRHCAFADFDELPRGLQQDCQHVARWCVTGHEENPHIWANRYFYLQRRATDFVEQNKEAIIAVAESLYRQTALSGDEISKILTEVLHDVALLG
ncbi:MAG: hypothetical protein KF752_03165 [Pirellulaceae bacterium]|nr:hypothetical protein [Pirellulaceae bacterium]